MLGGRVVPARHTSTFASRTTVDLIKELQTAAKDVERAALIVRFDRHIEYVQMDNPNPIEALSVMVLRKGEPVGLFVMNHGVVKLRPLKEYQHQHSVCQFLNQLSPEIQTRVRIFGNQGFLM